MPRIAVTSFVFLFASTLWATPPQKNCDSFIRAFNPYDELVKGKVVDKVSLFEMTEWSKEGQFKGFVAIKEVVPKDAELILEYRMKSGGPAIKSQKSGFSEWKWDSKHHKANIDTEKFFAGLKPGGIYTVRLTTKGKTLCEESLPYTVEGD